MLLIRASHRKHFPIYPDGHEAGGYPENSRRERSDSALHFSNSLGDSGGARPKSRAISLPKI